MGITAPIASTIRPPPAPAAPIRLTYWENSRGSIVRASLPRPLNRVPGGLVPLHSDAERLSLALDAAKLGDWSWDAATDVVTFSERAAQIFQIPAGPHMTWTAMRDLLHPGDAERARAAVEHAIQTHTDYDIEYR